jgi:hypothetical protein
VITYYISVVDPHQFHADLDPDLDSTYQPDAYPDAVLDADSDADLNQTFHTDADLDPDPSINKGSNPWKSAKIGSYTIHFGLTSEYWSGSGSGFLFDAGGSRLLK